VQRNKQMTRDKILEAVGRLLSKGDFRSIGINAVAREAGVDKVLIYRYFGGLPELLAAYASESEYWPGFDELTRRASDAGASGSTAIAGAMLVGFLRALRERPVTQEILRWELHERNELTEALAEAREREGMRILSEFESDDVDLAAMVSLAAAGATYLVLRAKTADTYNGIDLHSEEGWARIEGALRWLAEHLPERGSSQT
jgi:AcrR family transcriptional regulator